MDRKFITLSTIRQRIETVLKTYNEQQKRLQRYDPCNSDDAASQNISSTNSEYSCDDATEQPKDFELSTGFQSTKRSEDSLKFNRFKNGKAGENKTKAATSSSCKNNRKSMKKSRASAKSRRKCKN